MKKVSLLLTTLVLTSLLLAACGGQGTSTSAPRTNVPSATSTEIPISTASSGDLTTTPNVPVTGDDSPNRLSNLMGYDVWNQNGDQIGTVNDMVLDFDNSSIPYVVVGTGGFLGLGEKKVLVPWKMLKVQTGGNGTAGDKNAFVYSGDQDLYKNFPEADLSTLLPGTGLTAKNWDATIKNYWQNAGNGAANGLATNTPSAADMTAQPLATATASAGAGNGQVSSAQKLQGVILASDLVKATIDVNNSGTAANNGQSQGNGSNTPAATTAGADNTGVTTVTPAASDLGKMDLKVDDVIVDPNAGKVQYAVVTGDFTDGQRTLAIPLKYLLWDPANQKFSLGVNSAALVNAPAFENGQYPDFSTKDWVSKLDGYWNNLKSDMLIPITKP
jgi:sporulation protein YlmC with PRC-barrel domain